MAQFRRTTYTEFIGKSGPGASPIFQIGQDSSKCQRVLDVQWADRFQAAKDFLGYSNVIFDGVNSVRYISRITPHNLQDPGFNFLYCDQFTNVVGIGRPAGGNYKSANDVAQYKLARISASYLTPDYSIRSDDEMAAIGAVDPNFNHPDESTLLRYAILKAKPRAQYLTLPRGAMQFITGSPEKAANSGINIGPGKIVPAVTFEITRVQVPASAVSSQFVCVDQNDSPINLINSANYNNSTNYIDRYIGSVNNLTFNNCRAGSLLLVGVDLRPHRSPFGWRTFDVTFMMDFSPQTDSASPPTKFGHNLVPALVQKDPNVFGWVEMSADGSANMASTHTDGKNIYDYRNLRDLFVVPAPQL
jgi:hypothetical protein